MSFQPVLVDKLQEAGVWKFLGWALFNHLKVARSEFRNGCECDEQTIRASRHSPHGRACSMWGALVALGLESVVVDVEHAEANGVNHWLSDSVVTDTIDGISLGRRLDGFSRTRWREVGALAGAWGAKQAQRVLDFDDAARRADGTS